MTPDISNAENKNDDELIDPIEEEINESHASVANSLTPEENISIVGHKYHDGTLGYLVHDTWDCMWMQQSDLKTDKPLLVAEHVNEN